MSPFYVNIVHRPEMVPEYIQKEAEHGKVEDLTRASVLQESLDIFRTQQQIAHENGLRTTIQMTYASLFNAEAVAIAKQHHEQFGDEIGSTFLGLQCAEFRARFKSRELAIWLFSMEDKRRIVDEVFGKFYEVFGFYPTSTGSYYMDAELVNYIKEKYPMVKVAVATCWEEGPKAYWNANNSWYTLMDGGPWNPWVPSKRNIHCPASDEADDIGIVAIPHLSRDLMAVFDGPGSYYGTHPQNILRGMVYEDREIPYFKNLVDHYRALAKYNRGYAYNMMYVGPGWMSKNGRWECDYDFLLKSYREGMSYYGELKKHGLLQDLTMSEFADVYRQNRPYTRPECALWKDILYGSHRQMFWYADPSMRLCLDMNQGGAMVDLRPYAAKLVRPCGVGTKANQDASYPFLIQSLYRAGFFTHYAGEGAVKSCKIGYGHEQVDLCACRTQASFSEEGDTRVVTLDPVTIEFADCSVRVQSIFRFHEGSGEVEIIRRVLDSTNPSATISIDEYVTACYGTTEYPEDLTGVRLSARGLEQVESIEYAYQCREAGVENVQVVEAVIPQVDTRLSMRPDGPAAGYFREGFSFSPMYTLGIKKTLQAKGELRTWLKVEKAS
ncbi:MAG: hypothetical protein N2117_06265 [Anaerolineales bacterium]|nr:hypothetical protein [Anaerolineales bacterium]MCX7754835.1 hypothetical protein [Anaerolineales bacterium]MDW8277790.1 hypothetical protein [Anaerolineales bacterium]